MDTIDRADVETTPDELVARAAALKPVLRKRQRETERNRRVPEETVADLKGAGLYKVQQPARYGGYQFDVGTFVRCASEIGAGCGSTGWVYSTAAQHQYVVVVDTAHGHSQGVIDQVRAIKTKYPNLSVIGGNIATAQAALDLAAAGADAVKVGIGPGSICTTRIVTGVGVPQMTAVANVVDALKDTDVCVISDGGIRFSGDLAKVIAAGANVVMVGSLLAGSEEAPGEVELYQGRSYKAYRGMGSLGAMSHSQGSSDRYFQDTDSGAEKLVPEGIEGRVPYKGPMSAIVHQLMGGLRSSMGYTGSADIETMRTKTQFVKITASGMSESHVHDVSITKEAPNYRMS